jgi:hypothetical protein
MNGMSFIFWVSDDSWEGLDTDMPTRHIRAISKVREVSAVSFPAYTGTDINARDQFALDSAKKVLDNARSKELDSSIQQRKKADKENTDEEKRKQEKLEFEKLKYEMIIDLERK